MYLKTKDKKKCKLGSHRFLGGAWDSGKGTGEASKEHGDVSTTGVPSYVFTTGTTGTIT